MICPCPHCDDQSVKTLLEFEVNDESVVCGVCLCVFRLELDQPCTCGFCFDCWCGAGVDLKQEYQAEREDEMPWPSNDIEGDKEWK